jgi:hypothetical protein
VELEIVRQHLKNGNTWFSRDSPKAITESARKDSNCDFDSPSLFDFAFAFNFALRRWVAHPSKLRVRILIWILIAVAVELDCTDLRSSAHSPELHFAEEQAEKRVSEGADSAQQDYASGGGVKLKASPNEHTKERADQR